MPSVWPLTGRAEELARISGTQLGRGEYAGVVIVGDPGVGKSRLAREALANAEKRCEVRSVIATGSGRALPLGAFAEWIRDASSDPTLLVRSVIESRQFRSWRTGTSRLPVTTARPPTPRRSSEHRIIVAARTNR